MTSRSEGDAIRARARLSSLLERLKNRARALGLPRDGMLLLYFHEAVMARLARSPERDRYVLKGGLRLYGHFGNAARPTTDIDLARLRPVPDLAAVQASFVEILSLPLEDGVGFDTGGLTLTPIVEGAGEGGVRLEVQAHFERATERLQLDLSFAPPLLPPPRLAPFPSLLSPEAHLVLMVSLETVVADKLAATVEQGITNTRLKDFYDLHTILLSPAWTPQALREAVVGVFAARNLPLEGLEALLNELGRDPALQSRWTAFLRRNALDAPPTLSGVLEDVRSRLTFLFPDL